MQNRDYSNLIRRLRLLENKVHQISGSGSSSVFLPTGSSSGSGTTDHGLLLGLLDDDHSQYLHLSNPRVVTGSHTFTPRQVFTDGIEIQGGDPIQMTGSAAFVRVTGLNADQVDGFHSSDLVPVTRIINAGDGVSGGGNLSSDITLHVDIDPNSSIFITGSGQLDSAEAGTLSASTVNEKGGNSTVHTHQVLHTTTGAANSLVGTNSNGDIQAGRDLTATRNVYGVDAVFSSDVTATDAYLSGNIIMNNPILSTISKQYQFGFGQVFAFTESLTEYNSLGSGGYHKFYANNSAGFAGRNSVMELRHDKVVLDQSLGVKQPSPAYTLDVNGDARIYDSFYAGQSLGFRVIAHTHDYDHVHVVVNPSTFWNLDEQFGVDIDDNLLVRGYIVGKHAIQIKDSVMICHFDGAQPYNYNFTGNPTSHKGHNPVQDNGHFYHYGKFNSKSIVINASGSNNYCQNPAFENGLTDWNSYLNLSNLSVSSEVEARFGLQVMKFTWSGSGYGSLWSVTGHNTTVGESVCAGFWIRAADGQTNVIEVGVTQNGGGDLVTPRQYTVTDEWKYVWASGISTSNGSDIRPVIRMDTSYSTLGGTDFFVDFASMSVGYSLPHAPAWGDITGHSWSGTRHLSHSTKSGNRLSYENIGDKIKYLKQNSGFTVMTWLMNPCATMDIEQVSTTAFETIFDLHDPVSGEAMAIYRTGFNGYGGLGLRWISNSGNTTSFHEILGTNSGTTTYNDDQWHHLALTVKDLGSGSIQITSYWDGLTAVELTLTGQTFAGVFEHVVLGSRFDSTNVSRYLQLDDFIIAQNVMDKDEIRAIYESDAPVFAETSTWHWRSASNRIWLDAEGMWGTDYAGNAVLGFYVGTPNPDGGNDDYDDTDSGAMFLNQTKTWGGVSLSPGDVLFGYSSKYMHWQRDNQNMVIKGTIRADDGYLGDLDISGILTIGTAGGLWQGTGTFASPTTGLKINNFNGIGKFAMYDNGVVQVQTDSTGQLLAGAGAAIMNQNGIDFYHDIGADEPTRVNFYSNTYDNTSLGGSIWAVGPNNGSGPVFPGYLIIQAGSDTNAASSSILLRASNISGSDALISLEVDSVSLYGSNNAYLNINTSSIQGQTSGSINLFRTSAGAEGFFVSNIGDVEIRGNRFNGDFNDDITLSNNGNSDIVISSGDDTTINAGGDLYINSSSGIVRLMSQSQSILQMNGVSSSFTGNQIIIGELINNTLIQIENMSGGTTDGGYLYSDVGWIIGAGGGSVAFSNDQIIVTPTNTTVSSPLQVDINGADIDIVSGSDLLLSALSGTLNIQASAIGSWITPVTADFINGFRQGSDVGLPPFRYKIVGDLVFCAGAINRASNLSDPDNPIAFMEFINSSSVAHDQSFDVWLYNGSTNHRYLFKMYNLIGNVYFGIQRIATSNFLAGSYGMDGVVFHLT